MTYESREMVEVQEYRPRGGAREIFRCRDTEVLFEGPAGTGKTRAALEKVFAVCSKYPGARVLLVRKTRTSMSETVLRTWEDLVVPKGHPATAGGASRSFRSIYTFPNRSQVIVLGMDKPDRLMSMDLDMAVAFEATELTEDDWEKVLTRIGRNFVVPYSQAIADCNPGAGTHWLNQRANRGGMTRVLSRHVDNPMWHDGSDWTEAGRGYLAKLNRMTGHRRERLLEGRWASASGVVYPEFDAALHVVDPFEIPETWRVVRGVDFGYTNPTVCQWWAIDPDDRMYLFRELYRTGLTATDAAKIIRDVDPTRRETIADHDADAREEFRRAGIDTIAADKAVSLGIQDVAERLRIAGDGKPRLFVMRDALIERDRTLQGASKPCCTAEEFDEYIWPSANGKALKEAPIKENDHGMDAMRYVCRYLRAPRQRVRMIRI